MKRGYPLWNVSGVGYEEEMNGEMTRKFLIKLFGKVLVATEEDT